LWSGGGEQVKNKEMGCSDWVQAGHRTSQDAKVYIAGPGGHLG
jgi:hypothetical protein